MNIRSIGLSYVQVFHKAQRVLMPLVLNAQSKDMSPDLHERYHLLSLARCKFLEISGELGLHVLFLIVESVRWHPPLIVYRGVLGTGSLGICSIMRSTFSLVIFVVKW